MDLSGKIGRVKTTVRLIAADRLNAVLLG